MMISFFAYHGDVDLRQEVIARIRGFAQSGALANGAQAGEDRLCLVRALAGGDYDLASAHQNTGFPAPLIGIAETIFEGLPAADAPPFAVALVRAATPDADLALVAWQFAEWMFAEAIATLGPSRIRVAARDAGPVFRQLADTGTLTPTQRQKAKAVAKKARRRGLELQGDDERLIAKALGAALDGGGQHIGFAVGWIANLSDHPDNQYRRYARKLLECIEAG
jgi:hypothetical protein